MTGTLVLMAGALDRRRLSGGGGGGGGGGGSTGSTTIPIYATPPSLGTTFHVDAVNGNDGNSGLAAGAGNAWQTLQRAAGIAAGSTVLVYNGTYSSSSGITLFISGKNGSATNWTVYKNAPGQSPIVTQGAFGEAIQVIASSYVCVQGFTVTGNNSTTVLSTVFGNSNDTRYNSSGIVLGNNQSGGVNSHHLMVLNCIVSQCPANGISTQFCDYVTIQGCVVSVCGLYSKFACSGISLWESHNSDTNPGYHNIVSGNIVFNNTNLVNPSGTGSTGCTDGEGIIIDDNTNDQSDHVAYTSSTLVANNIAYSNGSSGILTFDSQFVDIIFNTCYQDSTNRANQAYSPVYDIATSASSSVNVFNNIVYSISNTQVPCLGANPEGIATSNVAYGNNICFNDFGTSPGSGNITSDPNFSSTTTFALGSGSPALHAATAAWTVATDIYGNARPGGVANSIGAVQ